MTDGALPAFRPGDVLATAFTGTMTGRYGTPLEHIPTPARFEEWLALHDLAVPRCSPSELAEAQELREAIHRAATAAALREPLPAEAVAILNRHSLAGAARPTLTAAGARAWDLGPNPSVQDALGVIAVDAIDVISGARGGRLARCAGPTCRAVFLDTSQSRSRRWCDMNICGNRAKKARLRGTNPTPPTDEPAPSAR